MKKFYTEPELELVQMLLDADVLGRSVESTESPNPDHGGDFDEEWEWD